MEEQGREPEGQGDVKEGWLVSEEDEKEGQVMESWIKIYPKMTEWRWYRDSGTMRIFLHLLLTANFKDTPYMKTIVKRGQVLTSISRLSQELDIPAITVRRKLENLKESGEIVTETTNKWTIITICNYESYQGPQKTNEQASEQTNEQTHRIRSTENNSLKKETPKGVKKENPSLSKPSDKKAIPLPPSLELPYHSERFVKTWEMLTKQPKWKGKTVNALQLSLKKLGRYEEAFAVELMETAIERNYQGVVFTNTDEEYLKWKAGKQATRQPIDKNDVNALWNR